MTEEQQQTIRKLRIWQQNMNKSYNAHHELLASAHNTDFDIIAIQEPGHNFLGLTRANSEWTVLYPERHRVNSNDTRSVLFISRLISSNSWTEIPTNSSNITAIKLVTQSGPVYLFNLYIDGHHSPALDEVRRVSQQLQQSDRQENFRAIWIGDFNRHHPLWDEERNGHLFTNSNLRAAEELIDLTQDFDMHMVLPQGIPTLQANGTGNLTRPDNVFCSHSLADSVVSCKTEPGLRPSLTDHFPILTSFNLVFDRFTLSPVRNFRKVDWEAFAKALQQILDDQAAPEQLRTREEFDDLFKFLTEALDKVIQDHVPTTRISKFMRRWWTPELTAAREAKFKLGRKSYRQQCFPDHPIHEQYRKARNAFSQMLSDTKEKKWRSFISTVDSKLIWTVYRYASSPATDGGRVRIPTLKMQEGNISVEARTK